jgi:hypothetical protein
MRKALHLRRQAKPNSPGTSACVPARPVQEPRTYWRDSTKRATITLQYWQAFTPIAHWTSTHLTIRK